MAQIIDALPNEYSRRILCTYLNVTNSLVIARITNIPHWYFERIIFPGQRLLFEALPQAQLEIHTEAVASAIVFDTVPCEYLQVNKVGKNNLCAE